MIITCISLIVVIVVFHRSPVSGQYKALFN